MNMYTLYCTSKKRHKGFLLAGLLAIAIPHMAAADWRDYINSLSMPQFSIGKSTNAFLKDYGVVLGTMAVAGALSLLLLKKLFGEGQKSDTWWKVKRTLDAMSQSSFSMLKLMYETKFSVKLRFADYENHRALFATEILKRDKTQVCACLKKVSSWVALYTKESNASGLAPVLVPVVLTWIDPLLEACAQLIKILMCEPTAASATAEQAQQ
jgi:hypothetical protein